LHEAIQILYPNSSFACVYIMLTIFNLFYTSIIISIAKQGIKRFFYMRIFEILSVTNYVFFYSLQFDTYMLKFIYVFSCYKNINLLLL